MLLKRAFVSPECPQPRELSVTVIDISDASGQMSRQARI
jgi:hypothetical protein